MSKITLPSGKELYVGPTPWKISKSVVDAFAEELKALQIAPTTQIDVNLIKDLVCSGISSKKLDSAIDECLKRCTLNGLKITDETWEPVEARGEYFLVRYHVAVENITPFMKDLSAQFSGQFQKMISTLS